MQRRSRSPLTHFPLPWNVIYTPELKRDRPTLFVKSSISMTTPAYKSPVRIRTPLLSRSGSLSKPDRTLISGDVVQNQTMPNIFGDGGTPTSWLAVLDKVAALNAAHALPDHSASGDVRSLRRNVA